MGQKQLKLCTVLLFGLGFTGLQAQTSINASGGNASGSGGSSSYSVGQVVYQPHTGTNGSVVEGVQQPYEISVVTTIEDVKGINLLVSAYPNPADDYLLLKVEGDKLIDLSYQLYDIQGKILQSGKITGNQASIAMGNLVTATYFVKVIQGNKEVRTFKIVKR